MFTWQMGCVGAEYGRIFRVSRFRLVIPAENSFETLYSEPEQHTAGHSSAHLEEQKHTHRI